MSVEPTTYLIGHTEPDHEGIKSYLRDTKQMPFYEELLEAMESGISGGEVLCSFYAKLCYRSLVNDGRNANITKIRAIRDNLQGVVNSKHGAVFEHASLNFVTTNCSRVFTHELVRHRAGLAFSQTSGRYCTVEDAELVLPPELSSIPLEDCPQCGGDGTNAGGVPFSCDKCGGDGSLTIEHGMETLLQQIKEKVAEFRLAAGLDDPAADFERKKRLTSALRRIMPNGATNEIGWSINLRALRHVVELRTSRHAEWEIRRVFHDVVRIVEERWPTMFYGGRREQIDGLVEYTGLRV
jgi:thymidylate synthase (FAD)